jgi:hypothetical protein
MREGVRRSDACVAERHRLTHVALLLPTSRAMPIEAIQARCSEASTTTRFASPGSPRAFWIGASIQRSI